MTCTIIANGQIKLVLVPGNEIERIALQELCKGQVEVQSHPTLQIGDKQLPDAMTIVPKTTKSE